MHKTLLEYTGKDLGMCEERDPEAIDQGETDIILLRINMSTLTNDSDSSDAGLSSSEWFS